MDTKENFKKLTDDAKSRIKEVTGQELAAATTKPIIIDVREKDDYAAEHIQGAVNISRGVIEHEIAKVAPTTDTPIVCYCGGGGRSSLTVDSLQKMGYTNVQSLQGGIRQWKADNLPMDSTKPANPAEAFARLTAAVKLKIREVPAQDVHSKKIQGLLIDVRDPDEYASGHIPGAVSASRGTLESKISKIAPDTSAPLILYCAGGTRSAFAADMLQQLGYTKVFSIQSGIKEWKAQNLPIES